MIRGRAGLAETDDAGDDAGEASRDMLATHVPDPEERAWIESGTARRSSASESGLAAERAVRRVANLLRAHGGDRRRSSSSSRTSTGPTRACSTSSTTSSSGRSGYPIHGRHPRPARAARAAAGLGRRQARTSSRSCLEPLPDSAMRELLAGLVPGLPERASPAIVSRADGVPLYAVETVRMLVADGPARPGATAGPIGRPATLEPTSPSRDADRADRARGSTARPGRPLARPRCRRPRPELHARRRWSRSRARRRRELEDRLRILVRREILSLDDRSALS